MRLIARQGYPGFEARLYYDPVGKQLKFETTIDGNFAGPSLSLDDHELFSITDGTTLRQFDDANTKRCEESFHPIDSWSNTDWACAAAGEIGEACNCVKKLRRIEHLTASSEFSRLYNGDPHELGAAAAVEYADAVTYCFLAIRRLGFDPVQVLVDKFNEVSDRVGSKIKL